MVSGAISADVKIDSLKVVGEQDQVLFVLRDMITLGLISGAYRYSQDRDPIGPILASALGILLTKRWLIFRER